MKTHLTLSLLLIAGSLAAQPSITSSDAPSAGQQFTYGTGAFLALPAGAANQTWDFSSSSGTLAPVLTMVAAGTAMGASDFPNADVALTKADYGEFIGVTSSGLEHWGEYLSTGNVVYSDPEIYLPIPCNFGQSWNDAFAGSWSNGNFTGNTTANASGYGTLILPSITLANVLRVDLVQTRNEASGFSTVITQNIFYRPGTGYFVACNQITAAYYSTTLLTSDSSLTYIDASSIGIQEPARAAIGLQLMPMPATDHVNLVFGTGGSAQMDLINAEGQTVLTKAMGTFAAGIHRYELDLARIPAGLYLVQVTNDKGERGVQRLVVK